MSDDDIVIVKRYSFPCSEINSLSLAKIVLCGREHLFCGAFIGISMFRGCAAAVRGAWMIHQKVQQPPSV